MAFEVQDMTGSALINTTDHSRPAFDCEINFRNQQVKVVLWKNKRYVAGGKFPKYQGKFNIGDDMVNVAMWAPKENKVRYFLKLTDEKPKEESPNKPTDDEGWSDDPAPARQAAPEPQKKSKPVDRTSLLR